MAEEINKIKERLTHPKATTISIKRVPTETSDAFKKFANDHFVGDYGMALKKLVDTQLIEPQPYEHLAKAIDNHEQRLCALETKEEKQYRTKKTLGGKEIKVPLKEE